MAAQTLIPISDAEVMGAIRSHAMSPECSLGHCALERLIKEDVVRVVNPEGLVSSGKGMAVREFSCTLTTKYCASLMLEIKVTRHALKPCLTEDDGDCGTTDVVNTGLNINFGLKWNRTELLGMDCLKAKHFTNLIGGLEADVLDGMEWYHSLFAFVSMASVLSNANGSQGQKKKIPGDAKNLLKLIGIKVEDDGEVSKLPERYQIGNANPMFELGPGFMMPGVKPVVMPSKPVVVVDLITF